MPSRVLAARTAAIVCSGMATSATVHHAPPGGGGRSVPAGLSIPGRPRCNASIVASRPRATPRSIGTWWRRIEDLSTLARTRFRYAGRLPSSTSTPSGTDRFPQDRQSSRIDLVQIANGQPLAPPECVRELKKESGDRLLFIQPHFRFKTVHRSHDQPPMSPPRCPSLAFRLAQSSHRR